MPRRELKDWWENKRVATALLSATRTHRYFSSTECSALYEVAWHGLWSLKFSFPLLAMNKCGSKHNFHAPALIELPSSRDWDAISVPALAQVLRKHWDKSKEPIQCMLSLLQYKLDSQKNKVCECYFTAMLLTSDELCTFLIQASGPVTQRGRVSHPIVSHPIVWPLTLLYQPNLSSNLLWILPGEPVPQILSEFSVKRSSIY